MINLSKGNVIIPVFVYSILNLNNSIMDCYI